jgi:hypothetical protein
MKVTKITNPNLYTPAITVHIVMDKFNIVLQKTQLDNILEFFDIVGQYHRLQLK